MKKRYLMSVGLLLACLTSCQKDFLDKNPTDQIASETFWNTEADVQLGLNGVYNVLRERPSFNHGRMNWDGLSDIAYSKTFSTVAQGIIEPTSGGVVSDVYNDCYAGISRCNIFLTNVDRAQMDEAKKTRYKGEVLFLRASFYFTLTEFYGGVPVYTTPPTIEESNGKGKFQGSSNYPNFKGPGSGNCRFADGRVYRTRGESLGLGSQGSGIATQPAMGRSRNDC